MGKKYHAYEHERNYASDAQLQQWATDPDCIEKSECAAALAERLATRAQDEPARQAMLAAKRATMNENPFNPTIEVSADARHIVKHLWIIFVALPIVLGILFEILKP